MVWVDHASNSRYNDSDNDTHNRSNKGTDGNYAKTNTNRNTVDTCMTLSTFALGFLGL